jgi:probable HAF family extracellular repeat protein
MKNILILTTCIIFVLGIVGASFGQTHAYIWDVNNGPRDIGSLGSESYAYAINDSGTVVGYYLPLDARFRQHGFIWTEATGMVDLGIPGGGDSPNAVCFPTAINSAGHVVGYGRQVDGRQVAFFWTPTDGFTVLGDISTGADNGNTAYAINDQDQVTGNLIVHRPGFIYHAYLWSPEMARPRNLGVVDGAQYSVGLGINNVGYIVGGSLSMSDFIWEPMICSKPAGMRLLGIVPGSIYAQATAINDAGQIIGIDQTGTSDLAFYTDREAGLKLLQGLGGKTIYASAINQQGVIVGAASDSTGSQYGVMWTDPSEVPAVLPFDYAHGLNNVGQVVGWADAAR